MCSEGVDRMGELLGGMEMEGLWFLSGEGASSGILGRFLEESGLIVLATLACLRSRLEMRLERYTLAGNKC